MAQRAERLMGLFHQRRQHSFGRRLIWYGSIQIFHHKPLWGIYVSFFLTPKSDYCFYGHCRSESLVIRHKTMSVLKITKEYHDNPRTLTYNESYNSSLSEYIEALNKSNKGTLVPIIGRQEKQEYYNRKF